MAEWLNAHLKAVGLSSQLVDLGKTHHGRTGRNSICPPRLGMIRRPCLWTFRRPACELRFFDFDLCNILKVLIRALQASKSDGWNTDPFHVDYSTKIPANSSVVGLSDDKGACVNVLQYHHQQGKGLDELVERKSKPGGWLDGVDSVCIVRSLPTFSARPMLTWICQ